jgi:hypothetical protein
MMTHSSGRAKTQLAAQLAAARLARRVVGAIRLTGAASRSAAARVPLCVVVGERKREEGCRAEGCRGEGCRGKGCPPKNQKATTPKHNFLLKHPSSSSLLLRATHTLLPPNEVCNTDHDGVHSSSRRELRRLSRRSRHRPPRVLGPRRRARPQPRRRWERAHPVRGSPHRQQGRRVGSHSRSSCTRRSWHNLSKRTRTSVSSRLV